MAREADGGKAIRDIAIRRGLLVGAVIGALDVLSAAGSRLLAATGLGASSTPITGALSYRLSTQIFLIGVIQLTTYILLYMTGFSTYTRVKRVGACALSGLVAGGLGGLVYLLVVSVNLLLSLSTAPLSTAPLSVVTSSLLSPPSLLTTTFTSLAFGLLWSCASGAGLGALGALVRQNVFS